MIAAIWLLSDTGTSLVIENEKLAHKEGDKEGCHGGQSEADRCGQAAARQQWAEQIQDQETNGKRQYDNS